MWQVVSVCESVFDKYDNKSPDLSIAPCLIFILVMEKLYFQQSLVCHVVL